MKQVAFFVVGLAGLILISFLGWRLVSLQRENDRLREETRLAVHESITKGGMSQEDWQKIEKLTTNDLADATLRSQGLKAEEGSQKTEGKEEVQTQSGAETPQQKLRRLGFDPTRFHRVDATATTK